jgi:hypothetical protein
MFSPPSDPHGGPNNLHKSYGMIYGEWLSSRGIDKRFEVSYM